ncbi:MAG: tRNA (guanosine(37)-N1)-methyltransferase TrmD [Acidobacteria bacterium]|nr:tRNA (guanosine(37)-N1)-methyltransferase TrmD [Acidobacteriota bacterium]
MRFDIVTIFPRMVRALLEDGLLARAAAAGTLVVEAHDLREFTTDRHRVVDDAAFGGGPGMVLKPEPVVRAVEAIVERHGAASAVIVPSPQGRRLTHDEAARLSRLDHLVVVCGRYEGIDERVHEVLATEEISIGDYVLTGGELPALVIVEAVARLVPGVVGDEQSVACDSFARGVLDWPHYTRPAEFRGRRVPDVLLSGHHAAIDRWRRREALRRTLARRPDLLAAATLDADERRILDELVKEREGSGS